MKKTSRVVLLLMVMGLAFEQARAQSASELLDQAIRAYRELEFDAAAALLRRALVPDLEAATDDSVRADALAYLAATEFYRGRPVSASTAFRRLIRLEPRYRPDQLVFPPDVTNLFEETRRQTKAIKAIVPSDETLRVGADRLSMRLLSSSLHDVLADIRTASGAEVRLLYSGPIADSLDLGWDGLDATGEITEGSHVLHVTSLDDNGRILNVLQIPLSISRLRADTTPHPLPPEPSMFLPETRSSGPGIEALLGGVLAGAAVVALPSAIASGSEPSGARFAVGGVISLAGVAGFLNRRPGQPLPENVVANQTLRREWQDQVASVARQNASRIADVRIRVLAGSPLNDGRNP